MHYYPKAGAAEIQMESGVLSIGDEIMISGPTTGVVYHTVSEIRKDEDSKPQAHKGELITIPLPEKVRSSDKIYRIVER